MPSQASRRHRRGSAWRAATACARWPVAAASRGDEACERLTKLLLEAAKNRAAGGKRLDWDALSSFLGKPSADSAAPTSHTLTWGEIRDAIKADIAPGGPKARDRNPFVCFRDKGSSA